MSLEDHPMHCEGVTDEPDVPVEIIDVKEAWREVDDEKIMVVGPEDYKQSYRRVARYGSRRWYLEDPPDSQSKHLTLEINLMLEALYQCKYEENETPV